MTRGETWTANRDEHRVERQRAGWRSMLALAWLVCSAGGGAAAGDSCGATITSDLKLEHDLVCTGDALIAGADGITFDLNGHTIAGSGAGTGIIVTGRSDVTIRSGIIRNFAVAIRTNTSTGVVIRHGRFVDNAEAIDLQAGSVGTTVKANVFEGSTVRAIMLRSDSRDNDVKDNIFTGNRIGILVFGGVDSDVKDNVISDSSLAGIRINVIATGNVLKDNTLGSNATGIEFLVTPTGSAVANELKGNRLIGNGCGIKGATAGNRLKDNAFEGNASNICF